MLGISSISGFVEQRGFRTVILDALYSGWTEEQLAQGIIDYSPDVLAITAMTHEITRASALAAKLKPVLDVKVVVGGPHVTALPNRTLEEFSAFDYGIVGEGEYPFLALLEALSQPGAAARNRLSGVPGLVWRDRDAVVRNPSGPRITEEAMNTLPYPAFHHYYGDDQSALSGPGKYYVMFSARGCPYNCAFCMRVLGNKVRGFSPERICAEIDYAVDRYGAHTIDFADEIFLFNNQRTRDVLDLMISRGLHKKIRWSGLTRANMVTEDLIGLAKRAGCYRLEMGVESGDDGILRDINKRITTDQVRNAVRTIKRHDISLETYFILGHPNETRETLRKTVDLAAELNTDDIAVGLMVPYPGTDIYRRAKEERDGYRLLSEDWSQYDKFGGKALELSTLTHEELSRAQRQAYLRFYVENGRYGDLAKYIWRKRHAAVYFIRKRLGAG